MPSVVVRELYGPVLSKNSIDSCDAGRRCCSNTDCPRQSYIADRPISGSLDGMSPMMPPSLQLLLVALAGWVNQHQRDVIDYLREENRVLREQLGSRRLRFSDAQRQRLAAKARVLGRRVLMDVATI